jgi:hypothetical protein
MLQCTSRHRAPLFRLSQKSVATKRCSILTARFAIAAEILARRTSANIPRRWQMGRSQTWRTKYLRPVNSNAPCPRVASNHVFYNAGPHPRCVDGPMVDPPDSGQRRQDQNGFHLLYSEGTTGMAGPRMSFFCTREIGGTAPSLAGAFNFGREAVASVARASAWEVTANWAAPVARLNTVRFLRPVRTSPQSQRSP